MKPITDHPLKHLLTAASCALSLSAPAALAQTTQQNDMPPKLEQLEEGDVPAVQPQEEHPAPKHEIIEKRERGQTTSVEVISGRSHYYLKPNDPAGSAESGELQAETTRAPQWKVLQFDWKRPHTDKNNPENQQNSAPAPAPPEQSR